MTTVIRVNTVNYAMVNLVNSNRMSSHKIKNTSIMNKYEGEQELEKAYVEGLKDGFKIAAEEAYDRSYSEAWDQAYEQGWKNAVQEEYGSR
jgi:hypothetical protein